MGDLSGDLGRCLAEARCDEGLARIARRSCDEGRMRETKRVLLGERRRLVEEMREAQHGIDSIDHLLRRVSHELCRGARDTTSDGSEL